MPCTTRHLITKIATKYTHYASAHISIMLISW